MANWARIDENNIVVQVVVTNNDDPNGDEGYQWLLDNIGGTWIQTSYSRSFRKNYAQPGYIYNEKLDAFIPPKPFNSWLLNEETCLWEAPSTYPEDGGMYNWNEETTSWIPAE